MPTVRTLPIWTERASSAKANMTAPDDNSSVRTKCDHPKEAGENKAAPVVKIKSVELRCEA